MCVNMNTNDLQLNALALSAGPHCREVRVFLFTFAIAQRSFGNSQTCHLLTVCEDAFAQ